MNRQIEEMTNDICDIECHGMKCKDCDMGCEYRMLAEAFYNAGYRKASDVAEMQNEIATQNRILTDFMKHKQIEAEKDAEIERLRDDDATKPL